MVTAAVIYCRFSPRPDHDTSTSNERQEERCKVYCAGKWYHPITVFSDKNMSGGTLDRPGLQQALESLTPDSVLVVDTSDRLARDVLVYLTIQQRVRDAGARIEFADGTPPAITPEGELIANIFAAFSQYQRATIRKRTKAGLARKRDKGIYLGKCPIGYKRNEQGKLVPNEHEQEMIYAIIHWHKNEWPVSYVVAQAQCQYGNIRGKPWQERTIRRIIKREQAKCIQ